MLISGNIEDLSAFMPISSGDFLPINVIAVPVIGILLALLLGKIAIKLIENGKMDKGIR